MTTVGVLAAAVALTGSVVALSDGPATGASGDRQQQADQDSRSRLTGVYVGPARPEQVADLARTIAPEFTFDLASDFAAGDDWTGIEMSSGFPVASWQDSGYRMAYGIPLLPATLDGVPVSADDNGAALARGAAGEFDKHFTRLAENLVRRGQPDAVLRLGWEFNSTFFPWSVGGAEPDHSPKRKSEDFAAYWRRVVEAMRAVPETRFRFDWNPVLQDERAKAPDPALAWPGDDVVDLVGLDVYDNVPSDRDDWDVDQRWTYLLDARVEPDATGYGLRWQVDFAAEHGKRLSFPEWGLTVRPDGSSSGGGDNPEFIRRFLAWVGDHDVAYESYFNRDSDVGQHCLDCEADRFPEGAQVYAELIRTLQG